MRSHQIHFGEADLAEVQAHWPRLRRRPSRDSREAILAGVFRFTMEPPGHPSITDSYQIRLQLPLVPTSALPQVYEDGGRIPRELDHHVYPDGSLCLGSPLRLRQILGAMPSLLRFLTQCVAPFLYAVSWREQGGFGYPFAELAHGTAGLIDDYERLFSLQGRPKVMATLNLLALPKRVANKLLCPCGCGLRLGRCGFRIRLAPWRKLAARKVYADHGRMIAGQTASSASLPTPTAEIRVIAPKNVKRSPMLTAWCVFSTSVNN